MSRLSSLVNYNARRCEEAVYPVCRCHCGGALHGAHHSVEWIERAVRELEQQLEFKLESESDLQT